MIDHQIILSLKKIPYVVGFKIVGERAFIFVRYLIQVTFVSKRLSHLLCTYAPQKH